MKMFEKLNSVWKQFLFAVVLLLTVHCLALYNTDVIVNGGNREMTITRILQSTGYVLLMLQVVLLLMISVVNLYRKEFLRALCFLLLLAGIVAGLYYIMTWWIWSTIPLEFPAGDV
jgi:hypothetical protein